MLVRLLARGDGNVGNQRQDEESVPWLIGAVEDETCAWTGHLQRGETGGGGEGGEGLRGLVAGRGVVLRGRRLNVSALVLETGEIAFTRFQFQPLSGTYIIMLITGEILRILAGPCGFPEKV